jgi:hypothetical protein
VDIAGFGMPIFLKDAPTGITTDGTNLYVADTYNQAIRKTH